MPDAETAWNARTNRFLEAARAFYKRPFAERMDVMVKAGLFTPEEGERAKRNIADRRAKKSSRREVLR